MFGKTKNKLSYFIAFIFLFNLSCLGILLNTPCTKAEKSITAKNWMSKVDGNTKVLSLNIPGTHESATYKMPPVLDIITSCQSSSIDDQLNRGIRYLDIRLKEDMLVHHGGIPCYKKLLIKKLYFKDILDDIKAFLQKNNTETVILQIKPENCKGNDFEKNLEKSLSQEDIKNIIFKSDKDISEVNLDEARGKIILVIRDADTDGAYRFRGWADDCEFCIMKLGKTKILLEDAYTKKSCSAKTKTVKNFYSECWEQENKGKPIICGVSCIGPYCPKLVASSINKEFKKFISENKDKFLGITLMDNPSDDLISLIYNRNL